ncbi:MAG: YceD family protein [Steroidobacter sp.]
MDAEVCARAGSTIARHFSAADLPRLSEAGGREGSSVGANFQFTHFEGRPAVSGELHGAVVLTCQRCMQAVSVDVDDGFQVLIVEEERNDEPGGYEPVIAKASRFDLRWLVEEQVLLALPLVPMHESQDCAESAVAASSMGDDETLRDDETDESADDEVRQQPFRNLRELMRKP